MLLAAVLLATGRQACAAPVLLTPHLSVGEQYNDNIFFTQTHQGDFITTVSPGLSLNYQGQRLDTFLSASSAATWYAHYTSQDNVFDSQFGTLGTSYKASPRLTLTLNEGVAHVHETRTSSGVSAQSGPQAEPPGAATEASTILPRGEVFSNFVAASAAYQLAPRWTSTVLYSNAVNDFTNPGGNEMTNRALSSLHYAWSPVLSLSTYYSYGRYNVRSGPNTESHGAGAGAGYQFGQTWWFNGSAGFYHNSPFGQASGSTTPSTGPTFDVVLTKQFPNATAVAGANQYVTTSAGVAGTSLTLRGFLGYNVTLAPHLTASLTPSYSRFTTSATNFSLVQVPAALHYSFWKYFSATLSYTYRYEESSQTVPGVLNQGSIYGNLVQLYVTASYPVWQGEM